jgi:hypothetical protein
MRLNNPFKMVGPWIGAGILGFEFVREFIAISASSGHFIPLIEMLDRLVKLLSSGNGSDVLGIPLIEIYFVIPLTFLLLIFIVVTGFLIGWGIQSLIRKVRK